MSTIKIKSLKTLYRGGEKYLSEDEIEERCLKFLELYEKEIDKGTNKIRIKSILEQVFLGRLIIK